MVEVKFLKSSLQNSISHNGKVGLLLLATDQITLYEFDAIFKDTGILHFSTRLMMDSSEITPETLSAIKDGLCDGVNAILPSVDLDVVALSCTSASMAIGEEVVAKTIRQSDPNRNIGAITNPYTAIKNALGFLGIETMGIITPYSLDITQGIIDGMPSNVEVLCASTFNVTNDNLVPDIDFVSIKDGVVAMAKMQNLDAIFLSCTNLNVCRYIEELEKETGITILTSNQVMAWDILRLCNYAKPIKGFGYLLDKEWRTSDLLK